MLGNFHPRRIFRTTNFPTSPTSNYGTNVAAGSPAHSLSASFVELEDSLPFDIYKIMIMISETRVEATQTDNLVSLYIGSAGNERLWIPTLLGGWAGTANSGASPPKVYNFPLYLPAGTRISAKSQSIIASDEIRVGIAYEAGSGQDGWFGTGVECLGANSSASQGTLVTAGISGSEGTWTDMGTSTRNYGYVSAMFGGSDTDVAMGVNWFHLDIGTGSAVISGLSDMLYYTTTAELGAQVYDPGRFTSIPSGTLVQVRLEQDSASADTLDCCVYGVF